MRILTLSNCDLVRSQGSGYVIMQYADGLRDLGHQVDLVSPQESILWPKCQKARSLRLAFGMWRKAATLVKMLKPDVVEFYGGEAWLATDRLSRVEHRPYKIVAHSNGLEPFVDETLALAGVYNTADGKPPRWYQGKLRLPVAKAFTRADAIVTVSQPEADYAVRRQFRPPERVLAIDNALGADFLDQPFIPERPKTIGYCGSWIARKGVALLATDLRRVLEERPDWRVHLVGVGSDFRPEEYFPAAVCGRIAVTGFVSDKNELRAIYGSWAIAVMPSIYESFGLVAAEAMACGCALVANRTGFAAELREGEHALLLAEPQPPHLYAAVMRLVKEASLRREIAAKGWLRVQGLRWSENISKLEAFYLRLSNLGP